MKTKVNIYKEAVSLLTSQDKFHIKLGLERVQALLNSFNNPQDKIKTIHVAGTNGKGSTCAMLASVLQHAGYKTGLFTSPHILEYTERIKINGEEISQDDFAKVIYKIVNQSKELDIPATEFEIIAVAAFIYFAEKEVDFAVIETGLGGRLDATNVIKKPELAIITDIDLDHVARLGDTIEKIAYEKAGIIKQRAPIITVKDNKGINIIANKANELSSALIKTNPETANLKEINLKGKWQKRNLSLVKEAINLLRNTGYEIAEFAETKGLKDAKWAGRFEYIEDKNLVIDAAHNPSAAKMLKNGLDEYFPQKKNLFLYSCLTTKDYKAIINELFRAEDRVILTKNSSFACEDPEAIKQYLQQKVRCKEIYITENIKEAAKLAEKLRNKNELLVLTGSIYTIGEYLT